MVKIANQFKIKISKRREDDFLWKEFLTRHLYSFLFHLHPKLYKAIDVSLPYKILDPALRISGLPKGKAQYLDFLTGEAPSGEFSQECFGTKVVYQYTSKSLADFGEKELRGHDDPAALALLAALLSRRSGSDDEIITEYAGYTEEKEQEESTVYVSILEQYFTQKGEARGMEMGEARGKKMGISIGEKRGISMGRNEGISIGRFETASQMLSDGVPIENIVRWTELPEAEILKLKNSGDDGG